MSIFDHCTRLWTISIVTNMCTEISLLMTQSSSWKSEIFQDSEKFISRNGSFLKWIHPDHERNSREARVLKKPEFPEVAKWPGEFAGMGIFEKNLKNFFRNSGGESESQIRSIKYCIIWRVPCLNSRLGSWPVFGVQKGVFRPPPPKPPFLAQKGHFLISAGIASRNPGARNPGRVPGFRTTIMVMIDQLIPRVAPHAIR